VLSIGRLAGPGSERYYIDKVAQGREDYYAGHGEAPGRWAGSALDLLMETDGEVTSDAFAALLAGRSPATGEELGSPGARVVAGFDLTFRAPKSVSLLFGLGEEDIAGAARAAHDAAVRSALGYLEREGCWTRRGKGGREHVRGRGFAAAAFRHRTSRAGDPTLHTHVVVANLTQGPDGRWTTPDSRQLYRHAKTAGYLYQAELRDRLTRSLGVTWTPVVNGTADIVGVPRSVIEHFSQRRRAILDHMAERGAHSARAAQVAALETRQRKQTGMPIDRLRADWRARAAEHGFGRDELAEVLGRADRHEPLPARVDGALPELTEQASTFDRRDVVHALVQRHHAGGSVEEIEAETDRWLASAEAVPVEGDERPHVPRRYSTPEMLRLEAELIDGGRARKACGAGRVDPATAERAVAMRPELSEEQADMVRSLTTSGDGIQIVRAAAGTGKTYALDAARQAWQSESRKVVGCALSARAAIELADQTGIPTTTIAGLRADLERGYGLAPASVLIVDEAGMVGTRAIADLAHHAEDADAKLVLCGDDRQLPEIEAGGALRGLAKRLGAIELREVRRQRHDWDRTALTALRDGRIDDWADAYRAHDRIVGGQDADDTRARLVGDWDRAARENPGEEVVMIAHRRVDVADLNRRARARLRATGRLGERELEIAGRAFCAGDRVVTGRNDRTLEVINGMRGVVVDVDPEQVTVDIALHDGTQRTITAGYLDEGHLDHGYAITAHRAQGATVDRAFVLGSDDLYREWGYTALSRHREEARYYVNCGDDLQPRLPGLDISDNAYDDFPLDPLRRERAKQLALDIATASGVPLPLLPRRRPDLDLDLESDLDLGL
jgi:Ti-type conjugative transfer relaxase TraA